MINLNDNQLKELRQLIEKWNNDTISLEEVGQVLSVIDGKTVVQGLYTEIAFLEKIKKIIDDKRVENKNGQMIHCPLQLDISDSGCISLRAFGSKECLFSVSRGIVKIPKFAYPNSGIAIACFNGEQISINTSSHDFVVGYSFYSDKGELMAETVETVGYDGRVTDIEEYYPLEAGKSIDGYFSNGYMLSIVRLKEPDRVWKAVMRYEGQGSFPKCVDRTAWIGNKDLRSGLGTLDLRDLPRPDEAGWVRMAADEGSLVVENKNLINECIIDPNYYDDDTLAQALLEVGDESLREMYREVFDSRRQKMEEEETSSVVL